MYNTGVSTDHSYKRRMHFDIVILELSKIVSDLMDSLARQLVFVQQLLPLHNNCLISEPHFEQSGLWFKILAIDTKQWYNLQSALELKYQRVL